MNYLRLLAALCAMVDWVRLLAGPGVRAEMIKRFQSTHDIDILTSYLNNLNTYKSSYKHAFRKRDVLAKLC